MEPLARILSALVVLAAGGVVIAVAAELAARTWLRRRRPAAHIPGTKLEMTLHPAPAGTGIVFRRTDIDDGDIPAQYDHVAETRLCTVLADPERPELRVGTVEHVLAALVGCGITNAIVSLNGSEVPILDGSAASFVFLIDCAGIVDQG